MFCPTDSFSIRTQIALVEPYIHALHPALAQHLREQFGLDVEEVFAEYKACHKRQVRSGWILILALSACIIAALLQDWEKNVVQLKHGYIPGVFSVCLIGTMFLLHTTWAENVSTKRKIVELEAQDTPFYKFLQWTHNVSRGLDVPVAWVFESNPISLQQSARMRMHRLANKQVDAERRMTAAQNSDEYNPKTEQEALLQASRAFNDGYAWLLLAQLIGEKPNEKAEAILTTERSKRIHKRST